jgi:hypothetical protein
MSFLIFAIVGNFHAKFEEKMLIFCFLYIWRELSQFLNLSALEGLVSYKPVSYNKKNVYRTGDFVQEQR